MREGEPSLANTACPVDRPMARRESVTYTSKAPRTETVGRRARGRTPMSRRRDTHTRAIRIARRFNRNAMPEPGRPRKDHTRRSVRHLRTEHLLLKNRAARGDRVQHTGGGSHADCAAAPSFDALGGARLCPGRPRCVGPCSQRCRTRARRARLDGHLRTLWGAITDLHRCRTAVASAQSERGQASTDRLCPVLRFGTPPPGPLLRSR